MTAEFPTATYYDPNKRRLDRVKRGKDLVGVLGLRQGLELIREHRRNHNSGIIFSRRFEGLAQPFFMTAAQGDLAVVTEILARGRYQLPEAYRNLVAELPIVDAGANIGASSVYFANQYPGSPVLAIEPSSRNSELLRINANQYPGQILPIEGALSVYPGLVGLGNPQVAVSGHHEAYQYQQSIETIEGDSAKAVTPGEIINSLQGYGFSEIGYLKISIKGAEKQLLQTQVIDRLLEMSNIVVLGNGDPSVPANKKLIMDAADRCGLILFDQRGQFHYLVNHRAIIP